MARFQIPEAVQPGFKALFELSKEQINEIAVILSSMEPGIGPEKLKSLLINNTDLKRVDQIAPTIFSFGSLLTSQEMEAEDLASELADSYAIYLEKDLADEGIQEFKTTLKILFSNCESLKITFKALELLSENDSVFREARILSDIRLVFNNEISDDKRSAVLIHRLKIEHQIKSEKKDFYVALDSKDLIKLKQQVERAIEKEKRIKESYGQIIPLIEITD